MKRSEQRESRRLYLRREGRDTRGRCLGALSWAHCLGRAALGERVATRGRAVLQAKGWRSRGDALPRRMESCWMQVPLWQRRNESRTLPRTRASSFDASGQAQDVYYRSLLHDSAMLYALCYTTVQCYTIVQCSMLPQCLMGATRTEGAGRGRVWHSATRRVDLRLSVYLCCSRLK